jgi:hypothetical protein
LVKDKLVLSHLGEVLLQALELGLLLQTALHRALAVLNEPATDVIRLKLGLPLLFVSIVRETIFIVRGRVVLNRGWLLGLSMTGSFTRLALARSLGGICRHAADSGLSRTLCE